MQLASLLSNVAYGDQNPAIRVMLESDFTKEIRIVFRADQHMKEHKTAFPIVVEVVQGSILFGVLNKQHTLKAGDIIALEGDTPHDLKALEDSVVRLTLFKADSVDRVRRVVMP